MNSKETPTTDLTKKKSKAVLKTKESPPSYSKEQLETLQVLQRAQLAKIAFYFALGAFTLVLLTIVGSLFVGNVHVAFQVGLTLLNGLIGWLIKIVYKYLFPPICVDPKTGETKMLATSEGKDKES